VKAFSGDRPFLEERVEIAKGYMVYNNRKFALLKQGHIEKANPEKSGSAKL